jgi:EmrB/QacA subfamily drug resistance transporter
MIAPVVRPPCEEAALRVAPDTPGCAAHAKRWVLLASILGSSIAFTEATIINVALPAIQQSLKASIAQMQWVASAYTLFLAALTLLGGALGDHYGRRRMSVVGLAVFAGATVWCAVASDAIQLIVGRGLQGVGAALLTPNSLAQISAAFPRIERGRAIGIWSAATSLSGGAAPLLGGWLIDAISWRAIFLVGVPPALLTLALAVARVPESRAAGPRAPIDGRGAATATLALAALTYGLVSAGSHGWTRPAVLAALGGAATGFAAFVWMEARNAAPMMPLAVFRSRTFSGANVLTLLLYGALTAAFFLLPFNLVRVHGYSATLTGAAYLPFAISMGLLSRWAGGLLDRYGARLPLVIGPLLVAAGLALLAWPGTGGAYWQTFFLPMTVVGIGMAVTAAPLTAAVMGAVDPASAGIAAGINNTVARLAALLAVAVVGLAAVPLFNRALDLRVATLSLPAPAAAALQAEKRNLGDVRVPDLPGIDPEPVRAAVHAAFVDSFRIIVLTTASLAVGAALCAALVLDGRPPALMEAAEAPPCDHLAQTIDPGLPGDGCAACRRIGARWIHLRQCLSCGYVGCCDASRYQHATAHFRATGHPIVRSAAPGEDWRWCYLDERTV